jgi:radical SAM PhpK family P-methyltransferase
MSIHLDCVVVGYNDVPVGGLIEQAAAWKDFSGTYQHLLANTVLLNGKRVKYPALFNYAVEAATGKPAAYNVARVPNLGACYLVSFLRRHGLSAEVLNFYNDDLDEFAQLLNELPSVVAITTTYYFDSGPIREIVDFVRARSPRTKIVVGGPHIFNVCSDFNTLGQDNLFRQMGADIYVFDSQGELTLARLCGELRKATPALDNIPNLTYTFDQKIFHRSQRDVENNDMDENAVDWSTFRPEFLAPVVQIRTARSCAFKCSFCRYPVVAGALNLTSLDVLERELNHLKSIGVTHLLIIDDTFNIPEPRFKKLCRMMIRNQYGFKWFSYFRCANADDESFDLLADAGCKGVFLGIESADRSVLRIMNKGATPEKYAYGLRKLTERGVISYASFIVGHPGETETSVQNTVNFIREVRPTYYSLETYFHDKKVPIHAKANEFNLTGSAYAWSHNTMDWRRASQIVEESYRTIAESHPVPLHGFDLWSVGYLMAHGFTQEQLSEFLGVASRSLIKGLDGNGSDANEFRQELVSIFTRGWNPAELDRVPRPSMAL